MIQGGWQRLFPEAVLETLSVGAIGGRGSFEFLPKGRGRSPINWSLIEGRRRFITSYFLLKPGVDDGDVFHHESFDINEWDDCRTLYCKNTLVSQRVLLIFFPRLLKRGFNILSQQGSPTYYQKRTEEDGRISWSEDCFSIYNSSRGITRPYPGAFCF